MPGSRRPKRNRKGSAFPVVFSLCFVGGLLIAATFDRIPWLAVAAYLITSVVTFIAYGWDKSSAKSGRWRTPELHLHVVALIGGWPGALAAQRLFRHKSSKKEFLRRFWLTVALNVTAISLLAWLGTTDFLDQFVISVWQNSH